MNLIEISRWHYFVEIILSHLHFIKIFVFKWTDLPWFTYQVAFCLFKFIHFYFTIHLATFISKSCNSSSLFMGTETYFNSFVLKIQVSLRRNIFKMYQWKIKESWLGCKTQLISLIKQATKCNLSCNKNLW